MNPSKWRRINQPYAVPLSNKNRAILMFDKFPVTQHDLDNIKSWIDLVGEAFIETEDCEFTTA
jgi:hypothetical protein